MPDNMCITESAVAICPIGELPSNNSPASPRLLCCCRANKNEERIPEYEGMSSVLRLLAGCATCQAKKLIRVIL